MLTDCDNCRLRIGPQTCRFHHPGGGPKALACDDNGYHYFGASPRRFPNANRGEPTALCGICTRALLGHRGPALEARAANGGW